VNLRPTTNRPDYCPAEVRVRLLVCGAVGHVAVCAAMCSVLSAMRVVFSGVNYVHVSRAVYRLKKFEILSKACLVDHLKHIFEYFKQYFTYFYTHFYSHIY